MKQERIKRKSTKSDNTYIIHQETVEQENAWKALIKALKMKFEISGEKTYDPAFVTKIEESRRQVKERKSQRVFGYVT